jgi:hypothetical protein
MKVGRRADDEKKGTPHRFSDLFILCPNSGSQRNSAYSRPVLSCSVLVQWQRKLMAEELRRRSKNGGIDLITVSPERGAEKLAELKLNIFVIR